MTTAFGTSLGPAGRALVVVVGPEAEVEVVVAGGPVACVVAGVALRGRNDAAERVVGGAAGICLDGVAGAAAVVAVVGVSRVVVDGLEVAEPVVDDVVGAAGAIATGSSVSPLPLQAETARTRAAPKAALRKRMATDLTGWNQAAAEPS